MKRVVLLRERRETATVPDKLPEDTRDRVHEINRALALVCKAWWQCDGRGERREGGGKDVSPTR